jgi:cell division protein FtsQ
LSTIVLDEAPVVVEEDPRIAERRLAVQQERRRRRRRWLLTLLVLFTAVAGTYLITRTPLFDVDEIQVSGAVHESAEEVAEASGVRPGDQILDVDAGEVAEAVAALPWIDTVEVERRIGGLITITVTERTPVGLVADDLGGRHLVDASGRLLGPAEGDITGLVPLEGVTAPAPGAQVSGAEGALQLLGVLTPGVRSQVEAVVVAADGSLQLRLTAARTVQVGQPVELVEKSETLTTFMGRVDQWKLELVDISAPGSAFVERYP